MFVAVTLRELDPDEAYAAGTQRGALVDLRPPSDYLSGHIHGALSLVYEQGPGLAGRARDCIPLEVPLILIDDGVADLSNAAASLRGKGFEVLGRVRGAGMTSVRTVSSEIVRGSARPEGFVLDVGDPGAPEVDADARIPTDRLWQRAEMLADRSRVVVVAGRGVRAALALGILERRGTAKVALWQPRSDA